MIILLADLPPPIHGMCKVNEALIDTLSFKKNIDIIIINTAPSFAHGFFNTYAWLPIKVIYTFYLYFKLAYILTTKGNRCSFVYRSINGGFGQLFDIIYLLVCRIFNCKIIIHHHSFNYFNKLSKLFYCINKVANIDAVHIVLGSSMARKLNDLYEVPKRQIKILSNIAFFKKGDSVSVHRRDKLVIGHLANLCLDKGIDIFINTCRELIRNGIDFEGIIAGPFADEQARFLVNQTVLEFEQVKYLGPLYGSDKDDFFKNLDVFVFPSRNEAEPLVLYEAAQFGVLNIGSKCGCMGDVIAALGGLCVSQDDDNHIAIANHIIEAQHSGRLSSKNRELRVNKFNNAKGDANNSLETLIEIMSN